MPNILIKRDNGDKNENQDLNHCAAEAVFCYTAENSHHLEA
jgi:hypothetical protein